MEANEYQKLALRTANEQCFDLTNCALGVTGEAGEFADIIKKWKFHGHNLDVNHAIKELGDQLWYISVALKLLDCTLEEAMTMNIDKLKERYPEGFSNEMSINRV